MIQNLFILNKDLKLENKEKEPKYFEIFETFNPYESCTKGNYIKNQDQPTSK